MNNTSHPLRGAALVALLVGMNPILSANNDSQNQSSPFRERQHGNTPSVPANSSDNVQATSPDSSRWQNESGSMSSSRASIPVALRRSSANELTGMQVRNSSGENLGKVKDFIVDTNSGQVVYAVIGAGGVAGIGESLHAVPASALKYDSSTGQERLLLDVDAARWSQAPKFRKNDIASLQADRDGRTTYQFYGQQWPQQSASAQSQSRQSQPLVMVRDLVGKDVQSNGQDVGEIEDVLVQLQNRSAAVVLDADASFAGQDQKYIVPLSRISLGGTDSISTTLARSDFSNAQTVQGDSWASASGGQGATRIYVWPTAAGSAAISNEQGMNNVAQNEPIIPSGRKSDDVRLSQQGQASSSTSTSSSTAGSTTEVAQIREALQNDSTLAQKGGRDVQVVAQGDKLVLLGTVQTKEAKDQIEERVERLAPNRDVDNQIRVATAEE